MSKANHALRKFAWQLELAVVFNKLITEFIHNVTQNIIHSCDPTFVICYLIWPCDIAVRIRYLISHSSSLSYNTVIKGYFRLGV